MAPVFKSLGHLDDEDSPTREVMSLRKIMYIFVHHKILSSHINSTDVKYYDGPWPTSYVQPMTEWKADHEL